jgi:hypothetical protein
MNWEGHEMSLKLLKKSKPVKRGNSTDKRKALVKTTRKLVLDRCGLEILGVQENEYGTENECGLGVDQKI